MKTAKQGSLWLLGTARCTKARVCVTNDDVENVEQYCYTVSELYVYIHSYFLVLPPRHHHHPPFFFFLSSFVFSELYSGDVFPWEVQVVGCPYRKLQPQSCATRPPA